MTIELKIPALGTIPARATKHSAGYDLVAWITYPIDIRPGETVVVPTNTRMALPDGYCGMVCSRSGMAAKHDIFVLNAPGIIDADYRGEIKVILHNAGDRTYTVAPDDRIAQLLFVPVMYAEIIDTGMLGETERGEGGFGSTGS